MPFTRTCCCLLFLFQFGCTGHIPDQIRTMPEQDIHYEQAKNNIKNYQNQFVRWGGKIVSVENKENSTWIEILANGLSHHGRPVSGDDYLGRFIVRLDGFLDPEHYKKDRYLTVYGKIESTIIRHIDDHPYSYPLIYASEYYLWPEYQALYDYPYYRGYYPYRSYYPYYHPRFYHPYYPYRYAPYYY